MLNKLLMKKNFVPNRKRCERNNQTKKNLTSDRYLQFGSFKDMSKVDSSRGNSENIEN